MLPQTLAPPSATPWGPALVSVTADHKYAYVVYYSETVYPPLLVQFAITARGLVYEWQRPLQTGTTYLDFLTINTEGDYFTYYINPDGLQIFEVVDESGQLVVDDGGTFLPPLEIISGHIDPNGKFYYSCRYVGAPYSIGPANTVAVYELPFNFATPLVTSTDPVFVQSKCN
ncbi:MAG: hypothetical protein ACLPTF_17755 [Steroidobacteraceae bacterium]